MKKSIDRKISSSTETKQKTRSKFDQEEPQTLISLLFFSKTFYVPLRKSAFKTHD